MPEIKSASILPGENKYLQRLIISKWKYSEYQKYGKWLGNQNDIRGDLLLEFSESIKDLKSNKLPKLGKSPKIWRDVTGITMARSIFSEYFSFLEHDLIDLLPTLYDLCEPSLTIKPIKLNDTRFNLGETKFGGLPDLFKSTNWPKYKGQPMGFLGQLNFKDFKNTIVSHKLPSKGLLSFFVFYDGDNGDIPALRNVRSAFKVIYTENADGLVRFDQPDGLIVGNEISPSTRLTYSESIDNPVSQYYDGTSRFSKKIINKYGDDDLKEIMDIFMYVHNKDLSTSRLFGCAHDGAGSAPTRKGYINFMSFWSEKKLNWCWLDEYMLHFNIKPEHLKATDFSKMKVDLC